MTGRIRKFHFAIKINIQNLTRWYLPNQEKLLGKSQQSIESCILQNLQKNQAQQGI